MGWGVKAVDTVGRNHDSRRARLGLGRLCTPKQKAYWPPYDQALGLVPRGTALTVPQYARSVHVVGDSEGMGSTIALSVLHRYWQPTPRM